ncbi:MAG: hypothetical protein Q9181_005598 [Wetmoreana brouardii]
MMCSFPLNQYVWHHLDRRGIDHVPTIATLTTISRDYQISDESLKISTVLTGAEFIQANIYMTCNNLITPEHVGGFLDWIYQVDGRWMLNALLSPRSPTTEIFAAKLLPCVVRNNDLEAARFLLSVGASATTPVGGTWDWVPLPTEYVPRTKPYRSALCEAIRNSNVSIVRLLLQSGAEVNPLQKSLNPTPLQEAVLMADPAQMVDLLLKFGANVDPELIEEPHPLSFGVPSPPLILAVASGNIQTIQTIVKAGADISRWGTGYGNAVQTAVKYNHIDILQLLVFENADVNAPSQFSMRTFRWNPLVASQNQDFYRSWTSPMLSAVLNGNLAIIKILLAHGADINSCARHDNIEYLFNHSHYKSCWSLWAEDWDIIIQTTDTPLQAALRLGYIELVRFLLAAGASVHMAQNGDSVLQIATQNASIELIELLLSFGAPINTPARPLFGRTPVQAAAEKGNQAVLKALLEATSDLLGFLSINEGPSLVGGRTALQSAAVNGHVEMVEFLLVLGANVNGPVADRYGLTTLQAAAQSRNTVVARLVLAAGADTNNPCNTTPAIAIAIRNNDLAMFNLLFPYSDVKAYDCGGQALLKAVQHGDTGTAKILLEAGVDVRPSTVIRLQYANSGAAALVQAAYNLDIDMVTLLVQYGADLSAEVARNTDILANALLESLEDRSGDAMVQMLLDAGAQVNCHVKDSAEERELRAGSLLAVAAQSGSVQLVRRLLTLEADPNWRPDLGDWTALQCSISSESDDMTHVILEAGADINASPCTKDGRTALQEAASQGNLKVVRLLLQKGADVNASASRVRSVTALQAASI